MLGKKIEKKNFYFFSGKYIISHIIYTIQYIQIYKREIDEKKYIYTVG